MTDAHNLYAKISSSSDLVTITGDSVSIGTLKAQSDTILSNTLGITVSNDIPDLSVVTFNLILKDQLSEKDYSIDICVHAPDLQIVNCIVDDKIVGNGDFIARSGKNVQPCFQGSQPGKQQYKWTI